MGKVYAIGYEHGVGQGPGKAGPAAGRAAGKGLRLWTLRLWTVVTAGLFSACGCPSGQVAMDAAMGDGAVSPDGGHPVPPAVDAGSPPGRPERCNGVDDDLDGKQDEGCPVRVSPDGSDVYGADIDGNRILWTARGPRRSDGTESTRVYLTTLPDLGTEEIASFDHVGSYPSLSGSRAVVHAEGTCQLIDLESRTVEALSFPGVSTQRCRIRGDVVLTSVLRDCGVWCDDYDLFVYDVVTREAHALVDTPDEQHYPDTDGDVVAWWHDQPPVNDGFFRPNIRAVALEGGEPWSITDFDAGIVHPFTGARGNGAPVLFEGSVLVSLADECALAVYDARTSARTELGRSDADCDTVAMALGERFAVVERDPRGVSDLWLIDRRSRTEHRLTHYGRHSTGARISGDYVIWLDDRNDAFDVYYTDLSDLEAGDFFPEGRPLP